jgi:hypothetical protein
LAIAIARIARLFVFALVTILLGAGINTANYAINLDRYVREMRS